MDQLGAFSSSAKALARNPLGIIALFIVLIYGFASLVVGFSDRLKDNERILLVWFLVSFPPVVLGTFAWLVSRHHTKLYAPSDYREDVSFLEASRHQVDVAVAVGAALAQRHGTTAPTEETIRDTHAAADLVARAVTPQAVRKTQRRTILWADDRPGNNVFARQALEALGFRFVLSTSTEDALAELKTRSFDAIISDMGRPPDPQAGYTLLDEARGAGYRGPFFIYAGSRSLEHQIETRKRGAQGTTNRPDELIGMVLDAMGVPPARV